MSDMFITIQSYEEPVAIVRKDQIVGVTFDTEDEWIILIHLLNGSIMKVASEPGVDTGDKILAILSDLGWT